MGDLADRLGVTRPRYAQIRRHVHIERELRAMRRRRRDRILTDVLTGRYHRDPEYYTELR